MGELQYLGSHIFLTKLFSLIHGDPQVGNFRTKAQHPPEQKELKYIPSRLLSSFQAAGQIQDLYCRKVPSSLLSYTAINLSENAQTLLKLRDTVFPGKRSNTESES